MNFRITPAWMLFLVVLAGGAMVGCRRSSPPPPKPAPAAPAPVAEDPNAPPTQRIPRALVRECPTADPADVAARDAAAAKLAKLDALLNNMENQVLWGVREATMPIAPQENKTIMLHPLVAAKLYLSLFMFTGEPTMRNDGPHVVVTVPAKFRTGLPPGEYPHALWHSADEWDAYSQAQSLEFVFVKEKLGTIYVPAASGPPAAGARQIPWEGKWQWTEGGEPRPRTAQFAYLFSADNPSLAPLGEVHAKLREKMRAQSCLNCHTPDNKNNTNVLILLDSPNQSLAARHSLAAIMKENRMPPGNLRHGVEPGLRDEKTRMEIIALADQFDALATEALFFESDKRGVVRPPVFPMREPPRRDRR